MERTKELKEKRAEILHQLSAMAEKIERSNDPSAKFTPEENETYDKLHAEQQELSDRIATYDRVERAKFLTTPEYKAVATAPTKANYTTLGDSNMALRCWALSHADGGKQLITDGMKRAADRCEIDLSSTQLTIQRTGAVTTTGSAGGDLTTSNMLAGIDTALKLYGGMRKVSRVIQSDNGNPLPFATCDDTSNVSAIVAQNVASTSTDMVFGKVVLGSFTYRTSAFPVSYELLQDSGIDLGAYIGQSLGVRQGRGTNADYTNGAGTTAPRGVLLDAAASGITTASATAVTSGEHQDFYHSVDVAYRDDPSFAFMGSDATLGKLWKIVDGQGRPLLFDYPSGIANSGSYTIFGKPWVTNNDMPAMTASNTPVACGAFSHMIIRDVGGVVIKVLNERYADDGAVGFLSFFRTDSALLNANAVKTLLMHS